MDPLQKLYDAYTSNLLPKNVFELINYSDIDSSFLGKEMLKDLNRRRNDNDRRRASIDRF